MAARTHLLAWDAGGLSGDDPKLDRTPQHGDWSALVSALRSGDFFVTTGEILIRNFQINGASEGGVAKLQTGDQLTTQADLQWTFPLNFCEVVWGDGVKTYHEIVPAHETSQFGQRQFQITLKVPGAKWARFAVWDVATDGALTQPVRFDNIP